MSSRPPPERALAGLRVLVTRAPDQSSSMVEAIEARGGEAIVLPVVEVAFDVGDAEVRAALTREHDHVVVTSANAAKAIEARLSPGQVISTPVVCVGEKTRASLSDRFTGPVSVPEVFRAEAVLDLLDAIYEGRWSGRHILFVRGEHGRDTLPDGLAMRGAVVDVPVGYRLAPRRPSKAELSSAAAADAVTFLSGATIEAFVDVAPAGFLDRRLVAVIGPVAAGRAEALGVRVDIVPERATVEDLLDAIAERSHEARIGNTDPRD